MIRKLIYKIRKRRFCKQNRWFCPDCIYHDFIFEGAVFRGNRCRYPRMADQRIQSVESVESVGNNDDIIVRSNLEPFRVTERSNHD